MRLVGDKLLEHYLGVSFSYKCGTIVWWSAFNADKMTASSWNFFTLILGSADPLPKWLYVNNLSVALVTNVFSRSVRSGLSGLDLWTWSVWALPGPTPFYLGSLCLVLAFSSIIKWLKYFGPLGPLFWIFPAQSPNIYLCLYVWYDTLLSYETKH